MKKAILAGATGLVGGELLKLLLQKSDYQEVVVLTRRELPFQHTKLVQLIVDFDKLNKYAATINGHALFCCLGSTRKKTPNLHEYHKIDYDYPVTLGKIVKTNNVAQYHLVSAIGANLNSSNFYTKMKGETEDTLVQANLPCLHIYQPSILTGNRKEFRLAEKIAAVLMKIVDPLLIGKLKKYQSISATVVARAMYNQSLKSCNGLYIHPSDHIKKLA